MAAEVVGGLISGSLAILSDAAHMLSDFSGFAISMISIVISRNKPTYKLSYGYHRAEILGALCSILLIWGLTIWLVYEAIMKIYNKEKVDDPLIMLIVAIIGLICNIAMGHVLHSAGGHHGHSHSHGHKDHHDEHHGHDYKQEKPKHSHGEKKKKKDKKKVEPIIKTNAINNVSGVTETTLTDPLIENSTHDNHNAGRDSQIQEKDHQHEHGDSHHASHDHDHEHENCDHKHEHENCGHDHEHENCDHKHEHEKKEIHEHSEEKKHKPSHKYHGKKDMGHKNHKHDNKKHEHDHNHEHHHDDKHDHHLEHEGDDHGHDHHGHDNLNIRAAFIHVIGDLVQSVGVVLAAVFIMIWPQYDIIDPICTFVFSIIVVCTTIPILCDCIRVFMEGTPAGINPDKILEDLHKVIFILLNHF
jgi:zinc transporter 2